MHIDNRHDSVLREKQNRTKKKKKLNGKRWQKKDKYNKNREVYD